MAMRAATVAQPPVGGGLDPEGLRGYRLALAREARRFKHYPAQALAAELGGTVELRVTVRESGTPAEARLSRSSGVAVLDEAALDMLRQALPITLVPPSLQGQAFSISLPVVFEPPE